jgi:hypothetical protein
VLQGLDLLGKVNVEAGRLTRAHGGQALFHLGERQKPKADLEQRHGEQADAGQCQCQGEPISEVVQAGLDFTQRAGDGDGIALRLFALSKHVNGLGNAQLLVEGAVQVGPTHLALVGLHVMLAGERDGKAGERARYEQVPRFVVQRLDLPVPARVGDFEQRFAHILGSSRFAITVIDGVGQDHGEQHPEATIEASFDFLAVERINDGTCDR